LFSQKNSKRENRYKNFKIRSQILQGKLPQGLSFREIETALKATKQPNVCECFGFLSRKHTRNGVVINRGLVSCQLVTQAFANYIVDSLQDSATYPLDAFKYHAVGTGTTAESNAQTALITEIETREAGTQVEGASANIYKSVATITFTGSHAVSEHGIFSASTGGTLLDRSLMSPADNVIADDQIEYTYQLTVYAET